MMEKSRFGRFPYILLAMVSSYFVSVFRQRNTRGSQSAIYLKRLALGRLQAFRMYGSIGMPT